MLKMFMRISSVDVDGFVGREHHPHPDMVGSFVRITNMDTVAGGERPGEEYQVFHGVIVDANGEDVEEGGEVELVDHEIESRNDIPVLYGRNMDRLLPTIV